MVWFLLKYLFKSYYPFLKRKERFEEKREGSWNWPGCGSLGLQWQHQRNNLRAVWGTTIPEHLSKPVLVPEASVFLLNPYTITHGRQAHRASKQERPRLKANKSQAPKSTLSHRLSSTYTWYFQTNGEKWGCVTPLLLRVNKDKYRGFEYIHTKVTLQKTSWDSNPILSEPKVFMFLQTTETQQGKGSTHLGG